MSERHQLPTCSCTNYQTCWGTLAKVQCASCRTLDQLDMSREQLTEAITSWAETRPKEQNV